MNAAWTRSRRSAVKYRQESSRTVDGYRLSASVDEFGGRWSVNGLLAGVRVYAMGDGTDDIATSEAKADDALPKLVAAGLQPDPIWRPR